MPGGMSASASEVADNNGEGVVATETFSVAARATDNR